MSDNKRIQVDRLTLRVEGEWWNAYYAMADTMENVMLLGSIRMASVSQNETTKRLFTGAMQSAVNEIILDIAGLEALWDDPAKAPEHERQGVKVCEICGCAPDWDGNPVHNVVCAAASWNEGPFTARYLMIRHGEPWRWIEVGENPMQKEMA